MEKTGGRGAYNSSSHFVYSSIAGARGEDGCNKDVSHGDVESAAGEGGATSSPSFCATIGGADMVGGTSCGNKGVVTSADTVSGTVSTTGTLAAEMAGAMGDAVCVDCGGVCVLQVAAATVHESNVQ